MSDDIQAFPSMHRPVDGVMTTVFAGMTLRDYFAGQFLKCEDSHKYDNHEMLAAQAYKVADAMLKERCRE